VTATLAELYVQQGLIGRAREIYRRLAEGPDAAAAEQARRRLAELPSAQGRIAALNELLARVRSRRGS
jgi:lipopolysaccharide biosynthesis regulator YciM